MTFALTAKQLEAQSVCASDATHIMLFGGSRCVSGDTVLDGHIDTIATLAQRGERVMVQTTRGPIEVAAPFAKGIAALLGLSHPNSVSTYQRRYAEMPRPVLDLGVGRPRLWLRPEIEAWARKRELPR